MSVEIRPGNRVYSAVCASEFVVVRAPSGPVDLTIGGETAALAPSDGTGRELIAGPDSGAAVGERFTDANGTVEMLCTRAGSGLPAVGGVLLDLKGAKPLPASD